MENETLNITDIAASGEGRTLLATFQPDGNVDLEEILEGPDIRSMIHLNYNELVTLFMTAYREREDNNYIESDIGVAI